MRVASKEFFAGIILFLAISCIPLLWFKGSEIIVGHDNVYPLNPKSFLYDRLFTYSENHGLGFDQSSGMGSIIIHTIDSLPYFFGAPLQVTEKIVYMFWFFALLFSAFLFTYQMERWGYIKTPYMKYILPVLYACNFYTLEAWWIGERTKFSLMVMLPVFLLILFGLFWRNMQMMRLSIITALLFSIFNGGGWKGVTLYGGILLSALTFLLFTIFVDKTQEKFHLLRRFFLFSMITTIWFCLFNAYSLFPFLSHTLSQYQAEVSSKGGPQEVFGWVDDISRETSLINLFRFQGIPEWYGNPDHPYATIFTENELFISISFVFVVFIFISFLFQKDKQEQRIFSYISFFFIISIFFSAGSHKPFGIFYKLFILVIPGFAIFRGPIFKFGYAYWFAGGFLCAYVLSKLIEIFVRYFAKKKKPIIALKIFAVVLCVCLLFIYHFPFLTGNIFSWSKGQLENRVEVPSYVYQAIQWIDQRPDSYRILLLPRANDNWKADTYNWKFFSLNPLTSLISRKPFVYNNSSYDAAESHMVNQLYDAILEENSPLINRLSQVLKIKYFIVRKDYFSTLDWSPSEPFQIYANALRANQDFSFIQNFGSWDIYELAVPIENNHVQLATALTIINRTEGAENALALQAYANAYSGNNTVIAEETSTISNLQLPQQSIFTFPCVTCNLLLSPLEIRFPSISIFPDSPLYKYSQGIKSLVKHKSRENPTLYDFLGLTLIQTKYIEYMFRFSSESSWRKETAIANSLASLVDLYNNISTKLKQNQTTEEQDLTTLYTVVQYIKTEHEIITNAIANKIDDAIFTKKKYTQNYLRYTNRYRDIYNKLTDYLQGINVITDKNFYPDIPQENVHIFLKTNDETLVPSYKTISLNTDTRTLISQGIQKKFIDYGISSLPANKKISTQYNQQNLAVFLNEETDKPPYLMQEKCYGITIFNVNKKDIFDAHITYNNNFSDNVQFVSYGKDLINKGSDDKATYALAYLHLDRENTNTKDIIIRPDMDSKATFFGICGQELYKSYFGERIFFELYKVNVPELISASSKEMTPLPLPRYVVKKIDQTKYEITYPEAMNQNQYVLAMFEQFDSDWKVYTYDNRARTSVFDTWFKKPLDESFHFKANGYMNGWVIANARAKRIIIEYKPQKLFYQGIIVTLLSLIGGIVVLAERRKTYE